MQHGTAARAQQARTQPTCSCCCLLWYQAIMACCVCASRACHASNFSTLRSQLPQRLYLANSRLPCQEVLSSPQLDLAVQLHQPSQTYLLSWWRSSPSRHKAQHHLRLLVAAHPVSQLGPWPQPLPGEPELSACWIQQARAANLLRAEQGLRTAQAEETSSRDWLRTCGQAAPSPLCLQTLAAASRVLCSSGQPACLLQVACRSWDTSSTSRCSCSGVKLQPFCTCSCSTVPRQHVPRQRSAISQGGLALEYVSCAPASRL